MTNVATIDHEDDRTLPAVPVVSDAASIMAVISRAASDPATDVDKLERLMAMYERITASQAKAAYASAMAEMQSELPSITERGQIVHNGKVISKYALWEDVADAIKPILGRHGFSLSFRTGRDDGQIVVTAVLAHAAGHSESTTMHLPTDTSGAKNAVQAVGSSTSYGKRYTAGALLNLTSGGEDDDGKKGGAGKDDGTITDEQAADLRQLAEDTGTDLIKFCEYMKVDALPDLPASQYQRAVAAMEKKRGKAA